MDNRTIDVVSEGDHGIALAMQLIWKRAPGGKATHYIIDKYESVTKYYCGDGVKTTHHSTDMVKGPKGVLTLIFLWSAEGDSTPLPFPLDLEGATQFAKHWLEVADYGPQPDHDGDNRKGWRIFTEEWGHVAYYHFAIVGIQPAWAMYGK